MDGLTDYSVDYGRLYFKYNREYSDIINTRKKGFVHTGLLAMNGKDMVYYGDAVREKVEEIEHRVKVNDIAKREYVKDKLSLEIEGLSSATIEGAHTGLDDAILLRSGAMEPRDESDRMVLNNIRAIEKYEENCIISEENLIAAWKMLVDRVCDNTSVRGSKYRDGMVYVGRHIPPKAEDIQNYMDNYFETIGKLIDKDPIVGSILAHWQLSYIHPFCDGNGRISRLVLQSSLMKNKETRVIVSQSLSEIVYENRSSYYRTLERSENEYNDITYFVLFYLDAMIENLSRMGIEETEVRIKDRQLWVAKRCMEHEGEVFTSKKYSKMLGLDYDTAKMELEQLVEAGHLGRRKNGKYFEYGLGKSFKRGSKD